MMMEAEISPDVENDVHLLLGYSFGGTTIITKFLNSIEGVVAVNEPFVAAGLHGRIDDQNFGKFGPLNCSQDAIFSEVCERVKENYHLGFIKETFYSAEDRKKLISEVFSEDFDGYLFLFRRPSIIFDKFVSQPNSERYNTKTAEEAMDMFHDMALQVYEESDKTVNFLYYEDFCRSTLRHFNRLMGSAIEVLSESVFLGSEVGQQGNPIAQNSNRVYAPRDYYYALNFRDVNRIDRKYLEKYERLYRKLRE